jgi:hypothetical protein
MEACSGTVGWGAVPKAGRSRARFPTVSLELFIDILFLVGAQWLRHCATNRKVAGSIPDGVGFFHWHNPSGRTMSLGPTQPLTEMSTRNISWGKGGRCVGLTTLPLATFMCRLSWNLGASTSWNPQGMSRPVMGLLYLFFTPEAIYIQMSKSTFNWKINLLKPSVFFTYHHA